jgi:putative OPT family oligopeptide transporter
VLGVLFSVPLRRSLIMDQQLNFPEGRAAAEVLRAGENPAEGLKILGLAALGSSLAKIAAASGFKLIPDTAYLSGFVGKAVAYVGTNLSAALLGVGYIVGFNIGVVTVAGSVISWNLVIPIYMSLFLDGNPGLARAVAGQNAADAAGILWSQHIRYLGVGAMVVGGVWTLIRLRGSLASGIRSGLAVARAGSGAVIPEHERDIPMKWILVGIVLFTIPLGLLYHNIVGSLAVSLPMTLIMIVAGFLFCSVSAYMAGLVGSSNNPVSGITIATILFAAAVLLGLMGSKAVMGPVAAIMIGAVVCCAACVAGDNLQDLKAGHMVGATPWKQQLMLAIGSVVCALVMTPVLNLLAGAYGIGVPTLAHPKPLLAPQATLMASVARGMFGGSLPWNMVVTGALIGIAIIGLDEILRARGARFRVPVLAAAVGIYLPMDVTMPIFLGGGISWLATRALHRHAKSQHRAGRAATEEAIERLGRKGVLFAAGLITGEALMGIVIAVPIVLTANSEVLALPASLRFGQWLGVLVLAGLGYALYRAATASTRAI